MLIRETRTDIIIYYDSFLALVCLYLMKPITKMYQVKNNNFAVSVVVWNGKTQNPAT